MSRLFTPVEFKEPEDPGHQKPKTKVVWDKEKLQMAWTKIEVEIKRIKSGSSDYVPRGINPGSFGFPAENAMKIFIENPIDKSFKGIKEICRQDFMSRAGDLFYDLLKECREEVPNE